MLRGMSIRGLLVGFAALLLSVVLGSGYWLMQAQMREAVHGLSQAELSMLAGSIRNNIVYMMKSGADMNALDASYQSLRQQYPEILDLRVLHGPAVTRQFGVHPNEMPRDEIDRRGVVADVPVIVEQNNSKGQEIVRFVSPMKAEANCLRCHEAQEGEHLGALSMTMNVSPVYARIRAQQRTQLFVTLGEMLALLGMLALVGHLLVFRPLQRLNAGARRLAGGDFSAPVAGASGNEIGTVIAAFNDMAEQLQSLLSRQDDLIQEQASELTELVEQSQLLSTTADEQEMLERFARSLTDAAKVAWSCIAILDDATARLEIRACHSVRDPSHSGLHKKFLTQSEIPKVWQLMLSRQSAVLQPHAGMSDDETALLFPNRESNVLCMPINHKSAVHGMVLFGEFRSQERDPLDDRKVGLCRAMVNLIGSGIEIGRLFSHLTSQSEEVVLAMAEAVEKKSPWTAGHSKRVTDYAVMIAEALGCDARETEKLRVAGLLHDIGKIGMPGLILNKQGRLTEEEYAVVKRHPEDGAHILSKMHLFREMVPAIRHHHEWYDGKGYPDGLRGAEIPMHARILAVADAFDAMTADRPYRQGYLPEEAIRRLHAGAGSQFDPEIVEVFGRAYERQYGSF